MSEHDELEPELRDLLRRAGAHSTMPTDAPERLFSKVSATIGLGVGLGVGAAGSAGASVAGSATKASGASSAAGKIAALMTWPTLAVFAAGAAVGAAGHAGYVHLRAGVQSSVSVPSGMTAASSVAPPPEAAASVEAPTATASAASPSPSPNPSAAREGRPESVATAAATATAPSAASAARVDEGGDPDRSLAAERAALEIARTAVGRGQAAAALTELDKHAQRFPRSRLSDERDSLRIQALMLAGRTAEAKQRLAEFRRRRPKSLFLPALEAALGE